MHGFQDKPQRICRYVCVYINNFVIFWSKSKKNLVIIVSFKFPIGYSGHRGNEERRNEYTSNYDGPFASRTNYVFQKYIPEIAMLTMDIPVVPVSRWPDCPANFTLPFSLLFALVIRPVGQTAR